MPDWPEVLNQYGPVVWKVVYRLVGNHADAADCFQDTFVRALQVAGQSQIQSWPGLLRRLATQAALDRLRQRIRIASRSTGLPDGELMAGSGPDPVAAIEESELAEQLRQALVGLPPMQAEAFVLRHIHDLSYQEIGELMGIEANAVGVLLHRARTRLAGRFGVRLSRKRGCVDA